MKTNIKKTIAVGLVALAAFGSFATVPAQAHYWGGGFRGHYGFGWGAAGLFTGLALGAIAANAATYQCGTVRQAVVNEYGYIVGYRYVPAC